MLSCRRRRRYLSTKKGADMFLDDGRDCFIVGDFNFGDGEEGEDMLIRRSNPKTPKFLILPVILMMSGKICILMILATLMIQRAILWLD